MALGLLQAVPALEKREPVEVLGEKKWAAFLVAVRKALAMPELPRAPADS